MAAIKLNPWPEYTEDDISVAAEILRSGKVNYWTGVHGRQFEKEFAAYCVLRKRWIMR